MKRTLDGRSALALLSFALFAPGCDSGERAPTAPDPAQAGPAALQHELSSVIPSSDDDVLALERAIEREPVEGTRQLVRSIAGSVAVLSPEQFARLRERVASELPPDQAITLVREGLERAPDDASLAAWLLELEEWNTRILRGVDVDTRDY